MNGLQLMQLVQVVPVALVEESVALVEESVASMDTDT